jgi:hypothetical protein
MTLWLKKIHNTTQSILVRQLPLSKTAIEKYQSNELKRSKSPDAGWGGRKYQKPGLSENSKAAYLA